MTRTGQLVEQKETGRYDHNRYVKPRLGGMRLGEIEPRRLARSFGKAQRDEARRRMTGAIASPTLRTRNRLRPAVSRSSPGWTRTNNPPVNRRFNGRTPPDDIGQNGVVDTNRLVTFDTA
jgi:hypothetical protein